MGGRGAGSGGRGGGGGGVNPANIVSTTSLISERESKPELVDQTLTAMRSVFNEYGVDLGDVVVATMKGKDALTTLGYSDGTNVGINSAYFNDRMQTAYDESVKSGFHPSRGNKSAMEAVVAHELGHRINEVIAQKTGGFMAQTAEKLVTEARKTVGIRGNVIFGSKISGYARSSNAETIAEAVADVYCNGNRAHAESKALVGILRKYL